MSLFLLSSLASAGSIFVPENGKYIYSIDDIQAKFQERGLNWVKLIPERALPDARYKILPNQNEFRMKDWYQQDWYSLQDMFEFDQDAFIAANGGETFNEAKVNLYSKFPFDAKKGFHRKTMASMSEWGGLVHPPLKKLTKPLEYYSRDYFPVDYKTIKSPYFDMGLQKEVDEVSHSELSFGNKLKVLADSDAFEAKKKFIKSAKKSILMSSLAFACDKSATEIVDLLISKHNEGVKVRVITDGVISKAMSYSECPQKMKKAGLEIIRTRDFLKYKKKSIFHSKMLVVDDEIAIAGGHNMLDADNLSRGFDFKNRDLDLQMEGPLARDVARHFLINWNYHFELQGRPKRLTTAQDHLDQINKMIVSERENGLRGVDRYESILNDPNKRMNGVCRFIRQNPHEDGATVAKAYLKLLDHVENYLLITDPIKSDTFVASKKQLGLTEKWDSFEYFNKLHSKVMDYLATGKKLDYLTTSMNMAGNENVAIMNEAIANDLARGKKLMANWHLGILEFSNRFYGKAHFKNLLNDYVPKENAHVWTHISFLHTKVFYFDRVLASLGSVNFQHNATDQAYESTTICMDEKMNQELDQIFVHDMVNSMPLVFAK